MLCLLACERAKLPATSSRSGEDKWLFIQNSAYLRRNGGVEQVGQELLQRAPDFSIERFIATQHYKHESDREHHRAALLKAQLPA
jgi:hypothetical protein